MEDCFAFIGILALVVGAAALFAGGCWMVCTVMESSDYIKDLRKNLKDKADMAYANIISDQADEIDVELAELIDRVAALETASEGTK